MKNTEDGKEVAGSVMRGSAESQVIALRELLRATEEDLHFFKLRFDQLVEELSSKSVTSGTAGLERTSPSLMIAESEKIHVLENQKKQLESELRLIFMELEACRKKTERKKISPGFHIKQGWIDFRSNVLGENWHPAEEDGRWSGPSAVSEIFLPNGLVGDFVFEMEVTDCISPQSIDKVIVSARNQVLALDKERINRLSDFPMLLRFRLLALSGDSETLQLEFPFQKRPADFGLDDSRVIGLKIRGILFYSI